MARNLGEARVSIVPDGTRFKPEAEASIKKAVAGMQANIRLNADDAELRAKIATVKASLDDLRRASANLNIDANNKDALAKMATVRAAMAKLAADAVNIKTDVDLTRAEAKLASFDAMIHKMAATIKVNFDTVEPEAKALSLREKLSALLSDIKAKVHLDDKDAEGEAIGLREALKATLSDIKAKVSVDNNSLHSTGSAILDFFKNKLSGDLESAGRSNGDSFMSGIASSASLRTKAIGAAIAVGLAALPAAVGAVGVLGGIALGAGLIVGAEALVKKQLKSLTTDIKSATTAMNAKGATPAEKKAAQDQIKQDEQQVDALNKEVGAFTKVNLAVDGLKVAFLQFAAVVTKPLIQPFTDAINRLSDQLNGPLKKSFSSLFTAVAPLVRPVVTMLLLLVQGVLPGLTFMLTKAKQPLSDLLVGFGRIVGLKVGQWFRDATPFIKDSGTYLNKLVGFLGDVISWLIKFGGAAAQAFNGSQFKGFGGIISAIGDDLTKILIPAFEAWTGVMGPVVKTLAEITLPLLNFLAANPALVKAITATYAAFKLLSIVGTIAKSFKDLWDIEKVMAVTDLVITAATSAWAVAQGALDVVTGAFAAILDSLGIGEVLALVGLLLAALVLLILNWRKVGKVISEVWNGIVGGTEKAVKGVANWIKNGGIQKAWDAVSGAFVAAWHTIENIWNGAVGFFSGLWGRIEGVFSSVGGRIGKILSNWANTAKDSIVHAFDDVKNWVSSNFDKWWAQNGAQIKEIWGAIWGALKAIFVPIWDGIVKTVQIGWSVLTAAFKVGASIVHAVWAPIWTVLSTVAKATWDVIKSITTGGWSGLTAAFKVGASVLHAIWNGLWTVLGPVVKVTWDVIKAVVGLSWDAVKAIFTVAIKVLSVAWKIFWDALVNVVKVVWAAIAAVAKVSWDVLVGIFTTFIDLVTGHWGKAWQAIKTMFEQVWNAIKAFLIVVLDAVKNVIETAWSTVSHATTSAWNGIFNFFKSIWGHIENVFTGAIKSVSNWLSTAWTSVSHAVTSAWNSVFNFFKSIWGHIENVFTGAVKAVSTALSNAWTNDSHAVTSAWNSIFNFFKSIWGHIENVFTGAIKAVSNWLSTAWTSVSHAVTSAWNSIFNFFKTIWGHITSFTSSTVSSMIKGISNAWNTLKSWTQSAFSWIHDKIVQPLQKAWDWISKTFVSGIKNAFQDAVNGVKRIWSDIQGAISAPIKFVVNTVYNDAIVPFWNNTAGIVGLPHISKVATNGFASGGKVPGWDVGDKVPAMLEGGEAVVPKRLASSKEFSDWAGYHGIPGFATGGKAGGQGANATPTPGSPAAAAQQVKQLNAKEKALNADNPGGIAIVSPVVGAAKEAWAKIRQLGGDALAAVFQHVINPLISNIPGISGGAAKNSPVATAPVNLIKNVENDIVSWIKGHDQNDIESGGASSMLAFMLSQKGKKYSQAVRFGPDSWDCSGLVWGAAHAAGVPMPGGPKDNSAAIVNPELQWAGSKGGSKVMHKPDKKQVQAGDLLGFTGSIDDHVTGNAKMLPGFKLKIGNVIANSMGHIGMAMSPSQFMSAYDTAVGCEPEPIDYPNLEVAVRLAGGGPESGKAGTQMQNGQLIYEYLLANLFSGNEVAAAGAIASIWGESLWNPEAKGTGGFGLIGWTGNSLGLPQGYHGPTGDATKDLDIQIPAIVGFVRASNDMGVIARMMKAQSVASAASMWGTGVERYGINDVHSQGISLATEIMKAVGGTADTKDIAPHQADKTILAHTAKKASGGHIPGYAPGSDTVPAMLSPGEFVLNPTAVRAIGIGNLDAINSAHKPGGAVSRVKDGVAGFAAGGHVSGATIAAKETQIAKEKNIISALAAVKHPTSSQSLALKNDKLTLALYDRQLALYESENAAYAKSQTAAQKAATAKKAAAAQKAAQAAAAKQAAASKENSLFASLENQYGATPYISDPKVKSKVNQIVSEKLRIAALESNKSLTASQVATLDSDKVTASNYESQLAVLVKADKSSAATAAAAKAAAAAQAADTARIQSLGEKYSHAQLITMAAGYKAKMTTESNAKDYKDYATTSAAYNDVEAAISKFPTQLNAVHDQEVAAHNTAVAMAAKYLKAKDYKDYAIWNQKAITDAGLISTTDSQINAQAATTASAATGTDPISTMANDLATSGLLSKISYQMRYHSLDPAPTGNLSAADMHSLALNVTPDSLQAMYDNSASELVTALKNDLVDFNMFGNIGTELSLLGKESGVHGIVSGLKFKLGGMLPAGAGFGVAGGVPFSFNEGGNREKIVPGHVQLPGDKGMSSSQAERLIAEVAKNTCAVITVGSQTNKNLGSVGQGLAF